MTHKRQTHRKRWLNVVYPARVDRFLFSLGMAIALAAFAGCGGGGGATVPAEGKVTLNGQPLVDAAVTFSPTKAVGPGPFTDQTDAEGKFSLGPVGSDGGGAAVGEYFLVITTVKPDPNAVEGEPPKQREIVPMAFRDATQRVAVPEGGKTDFAFDMKGR